MRASALWPPILGIGILSLVLSCPGIGNAADLSVVERWMATNQGVSTVRIDFVQTRKMRSLKIPVRQLGALWLDYSTNRFRWQVGDPVQTLVVGREGRLFILRPQSMKFEVRALGADNGAPPGMAALAGGFPKTMEEFQRKYRVLSIDRVEGVHHIVTKPLGSSGRGVQSFSFVVGCDDFRLRGMQISLEDGSSVETVFQRVQPNLPLHEDLFAPPLKGFRETKFGS